MEEPKDKRTKAWKEWKKQQPKSVKLGLGDAIENITEKTGIKKVVEKLTNDCGCDERKKFLNKFKLPVRTKVKRCLTDEQKNWFSQYIKRRTLKAWKKEDIKTLIDMYAHVFALQYQQSSLCINCQGSGKILKKIDEHLEIVYRES